MGFLDTIKDKLLANDDDYYDDEEYDDLYDEEDDLDRPHARMSTAEQHSGSGLLGNTPRPEADSVSVYTRSGQPVYEPAKADQSWGAAPSYPGGGSTLPAYVLRPESYDDVQSVIRRVRTNQPVVLALDSTPTDVARRVLDFCLGLSCGIDGTVEPISERAFVVLPAGATFGQDQIDRLVADGAIAR